MPIETRPFDAANYLTTPEDVVSYLNVVLEDGDPALLASALGDIARAKGMSEIARKAGLTRASLYKALSADGNPELATVLKVLAACGIRLAAQAAPDAA